MLTKEQLKGLTSNTLAEVRPESRPGARGGAHLSRLVDFFDHTEWSAFGMKLAEGAEPPVPTPYTEEAVKAALARDVAFGFTKALNQRGISSSMMYAVVKMWMVVVEDDLQSFDEYALYGLPLFKAVAVKYGFENPIGDDSGAESKYAE